MNFFYKTLSFASIFGFITTVQASHQPPHAKLPNPFTPIGYWRTEDGKAKVEVRECGEKTVCGKIIALKEPNDPKTNTPKVDPEGKAIMDMEIMKNFKNTQGTQWENGEIYDPKEGKTYSAEFTLEESGKVMKLRGYVFITFLGKTQIWHRTTKDAPLG